MQRWLLASENMATEIEKININEPETLEDNSDSGFDYENFMRVCPAYHDINQQLVEYANVGDRKRIIDLGCGTGNVTKCIIERLNSFDGVVIYAVDTSQSMLSEAKRRLREFDGQVDIRFILGNVLDAPQKIGEPVDAVIYCNSIHYVREKERLMANVNNLLKSGGVFAINSSFISESHEEEYVGSDYKFYLTLLLNAIKSLKRSYRLSPSKYVAESRKRLSSSNYKSLIEGAGMKLVRNELDIKHITFDCWYNFLNFKDFVEGALPGIPIPIGRKVLRDATKMLMVESKRYPTFQRAWMQMVAQKV